MYGGKGRIDRNQSSENFKTPETKEINSTQDLDFNLAALSWEESLGFLESLPHPTIRPVVFEQLMYRPFGQYRDYERLYMLARNAGFPMIAELCSFRANECKQVPRNFMFRGDIYRSKGLKDEARQLFQKTGGHNFFFF